MLFLLHFGVKQAYRELISRGLSFKALDSHVISCDERAPNP